CKSAFRGDSTGPNPTDRGKKIGTKRHVLTDQGGIPLLSVVITPANMHDMKAATDTLDETMVVVVERPSKKQNLFVP
ncbi:MAG: transposase, partial [Nitrososphaeraceae archaeon]|nr:transposase [Nitrososphaeraceae archaeon]